MYTCLFFRIYFLSCEIGLDHNLCIFETTCFILVNLQAVAGGEKRCFKWQILYQLLPDKENTAFDWQVLVFP